MTLQEASLVDKYREYNAQLRDALGDMIHQFGAGAGWRTEGQEAALKKALPVFLGRQELAPDPAQELRDAVRLADTYFDKYVEEYGWNDELEEKWPEDLFNDQETIRRLVGMEDS